MIDDSKTQFQEIRNRLEHFRPARRYQRFLWEFILFGIKQAWACLFGGILLGLVLVTKIYWPVDAWLARYDFLFLSALLVQAALLALRMETLREAKVILIFHIVGTLMELFKTDVGSWNYPESNFFRIEHVPLFSGFMYASVGSYLARVTRIIDMRYKNYPKIWVTTLIGILIYANFFTHHYLPDIRLFLFIAIGIAYGPTWVYYRPALKFRRMPLLLGFGLVAFFIWLAENIGTFAMVWVYPHQNAGWRMVHLEKYGSWFLLMIVSFILVTFVHPPQPPPKRK